MLNQGDLSCDDEKIIRSVINKEKMNITDRIIDQSVVIPCIVNTILCVSEYLISKNIKSCQDGIDGGYALSFIIVFSVLLLSLVLGTMVIYITHKNNLKEFKFIIINISSAIFLGPAFFLSLFKSSTKCFIIFINSFTILKLILLNIRDGITKWSILIWINIFGILVFMSYGLFNAGCITNCSGDIKVYRWSHCSEIMFDVRVCGFCLR